MGQHNPMSIIHCPTFSFHKITFFVRSNPGCYAVMVTKTVRNKSMNAGEHLVDSKGKSML
jgi:hypothetical protein